MLLSFQNKNLKNNHMKCIGLFGFLFGHKYVAAYSQTEEQLSADEKILLAEKADALSDAYDYTTVMSRILIDAANEPKKSSKLYIHHICIRCGDIKK